MTLHLHAPEDDMSERTEADVLLEAFTRSSHGNRIADALIAIAAKVRELDASKHEVDNLKAYEAGRHEEAAYQAAMRQANPPQPPKPKTAGRVAMEAYETVYLIDHARDEAWTAAAQAAHEFLSKPKVTAGELLRQAVEANKPKFTPGFDYKSRDEEIANTFLTLAREHGLLEGQP